ncbi:hypothetical protein FGB62_20g213 [Gracilaria domingensis]|nr:hypothetical protein FGB62_20g213 [Gracilaria domingensis]
MALALVHVAGTSVMRYCARAETASWASMLLNETKRRGDENQEGGDSDASRDQSGCSASAGRKAALHRATHDKANKLLAVIARWEQFTVATVPIRGELEKSTLAAVLLRHVDRAIRTLSSMMRDSPLEPNASGGRRIPWWLRSWLRKLLGLSLAKVMLSAMVGGLVIVTESWQAPSYAVLFAASMVFSCAVNAGLRDGVQWRLLQHGVLSAPWVRKLLNVVLPLPVV